MNPPDEDILLSDRDSVKRLSAGIAKRKHGNKPVDRMAAKLETLVSASRAVTSARRSYKPQTIRWPNDLPVSQRVEEIGTAVAAHQVVVVAGETGSGKSTQLPKLLLDMGLGIRGRIGVTQPRRIAARSLAARVADELETELGSTVGYQVRFSDRTSDATSIKFMTDGILLAELQRDPDLLDYEAIIVDEAHERSLNIDFILGYLKRLLPRRPELKVIVTSATIDTGKFARHFGRAEVIEVSGRGYPVDVLYREPEDPGQSLNQQILAAVEECTRLDRRGDILVFLATELQIRDAARSLGRAGLQRTEILPLYGRLSNKAQQKVFHPGDSRRIVLATNVAETSLTVPRIRFVIDGGEARIARYTATSGVQRLPIEPISQASANQRKGRCGRVGPGTCIRLYSEEDFENRREFTEPEILRTSLASVILQMAVMGLGEIENFPFVDAPAPRMINAAWRQLTELKAVDGERRPTSIAEQLARWPMDVQLARMILSGAATGCLREMLILTAFLSIQEPRERPLEAQQAADEAQQRWQHDQSDFLGVLKLWTDAARARKEHSRRKFDGWCRSHFLSPNRMREWHDLYRQLRTRAREQTLTINDQPAEPDVIHRAILTGLISRIGQKTEDGDYEGPNGRHFLLFPGSGLYPGGPRWLMASELVETRRLYARNAAAIRPGWLLELAAHLIKHSYLEPHWSVQRGEVMAKRQSRLYGLVVNPGKGCRYGPVAPEEAREIMIRQALVDPRMPADSLAFLNHNRAVRDELAASEAKRRRRDLLVSDEALFQFYDERLPPDLWSQRQLEKWYRSADGETRQSLELSLSDLITDEDRLPDQRNFPDHLEVAGKPLALEYRFEPGVPEDGITLDLPLALLPQIDTDQLSWLVPGRLRDKIEALLRGLPKPVRRALGPAPNQADRLLERLPETRPHLRNWLAREISRNLDEPVSPETVHAIELEPHLRLRVVLLDEDGSTLATGRDLAAIKKEYGERAQDEFQAQVADDWQRQGLTGWPQGLPEIPPEIQTEQDLAGYPALEDRGRSGALLVFGSQDEAEARHPGGVRRILACELGDKLKYLKKRHGLSVKASLAAAAVEPLEDLLTGAFELALRQLTPEASTIRTRNGFQQAAENLRPQILPAATEIIQQLDAVLPRYNQLMTGAQALPDPHDDNRRDLIAGLTDLVYPGFLYDLEPGRLTEYERYLEAASRRLEDIRHHPGRDQERLLTLRPWWRHYTGAWAAAAEFLPELDMFRWQLHEWRVSLFAQHLGTPVPVSEKRIRKAWKRLEKMLS